MINFHAEKDYTAVTNTICGKIDLQSIIQDSSISAKDAWINIGGWQSWNPGFEIAPGKKQPSLKCHLIHQWNNYLVFPGSKQKYSSSIVLGQFVIYFRWNINNSDKYLFLVSTGNLNNQLPPVQFIINRKENSVKIELADMGKIWKKDELQASIETFTADSYFEAREKLSQIFGVSDSASPFYSNRFDQINTLGKPIYGWESWYNHYSKINQSLIYKDLDSLSLSENIITKNAQSPVIFQIDDGWEQALGDWQWDEKKFIDEPEKITRAISEKNYIPGLWIAPFIIDLRSKTAMEHPEWLLRDKKGYLVKAGFNPLWGITGTFYCLDISNSEVQDYLEKLIDKIINQWGFRYLKFDFLYAGMLQGSLKEKGASYQHFNTLLSKITKIKKDKNGNDVYYLGCGCPFELCFNNLPLSRTGCDTFENWENKTSRYLNWNGRNSAYLNLKDTIGHAMWDKILFASDPDVIFVREENCTLTKDEKLLITAVNTMFGSQIMYSDDPGKTATRNEMELTEQMSQIIKKLENQTFAVRNQESDLYSFWNKDKSICGTINLGNKHQIIFEK